MKRIFIIFSLLSVLFIMACANEPKGDDYQVIVTVAQGGPTLAI